MTLDRLDLNLLRVFAAVYEERSVSRAARRLGVEQPTVSNGLARLRTTIGDELFRRTAEGMDPTPRAHALAEPVLRSLDDLRRVLQTLPGFDPAVASGTIAIALSAEVEPVLAAPLAARIAAEAPGLRLTLLPLPVPVPEPGQIPGPPTSPAAAMLTRGAVRLMLGHGPIPTAPITGMVVATEPEVALRALRPPDGGPADTPAGARGRVRNVVVGMDRAHALGALLAAVEGEGDWVVPASLARVLVRHLPLRIAPTDTIRPRLPLAMAWHRRDDGDGLHIWLRRTVAAVAVAAVAVAAVADGSAGLDEA
ncbi:MAG: hypothetical protein RLY86_4227 [Pseudomonadota bacterium]|jgi:DNA-binding transcriptional LysR family regulator